MDEGLPANVPDVHGGPALLGVRLNVVSHAFNHPLGMSLRQAPEIEMKEVLYAIVEDGFLVEQVEDPHQVGLSWLSDGAFQGATFDWASNISLSVKLNTECKILH